MKNIFLFLLPVLLLSSCFRLKSSNGGGEVENVKSRTSQPEDVVVPEGYQIELVAQGFTFPTALTFDENGTPYVLEAGYSYGEEWTEPKLLRIEEDGERTVVPPGEDKNLKLLKEDPGTPPKPLAIFAVHSSSNGLDVISNPDFGPVGSVLVAQFGDMAPFVGKVWNPVGFKVVLVDPETGVIQDFAANSSEENGPASWLESNGLERPIDVQFDPAGDALYIVDFGILMLSDKGDSNPIPETGVIWKISKKP